MDKPPLSLLILYYPILPKGQNHTTSLPLCTFQSMCVFVITLREHYQSYAAYVCCYLCVIPPRIHEALGLSRPVSHHLNQVISHFSLCVSVWRNACTHNVYLLSAV